jgi:hypothetical protein
MRGDCFSDLLAVYVFLPPTMCVTPHVRHQAFVPVREFVTSPNLKFQLVRNVSGSIGLSPAKAAKDPSMYPTKEKSALTTSLAATSQWGNKVYFKHVSILEVYQQQVPRH